jgi:GTP-binding protein LepA
MVKLDIMLNGEKVDALSAIVHRSKAQDWGRKLCEKLKELIRVRCLKSLYRLHRSEDRFRENISAIRKNVIAKCYGEIFPVSAKLLEKAEEG